MINRLTLPARERSRLELFQDSALAALVYRNLLVVDKLENRKPDRALRDTLTRVWYGSLAEVADRDGELV